MTDEQINKGNILIARYMTDEPEVLERDLLKAGTTESMGYSRYWDWIIPVYSKIMMQNSFTDSKYDLQNDFEESIFNDRIDWAFGCIVKYLTEDNDKDNS